VIKIYSLDERTGAISHSDDGDSYFSHLKKRNPNRSRAVRARYKFIMSILKQAASSLLRINVRGSND
jgi:hypothetical protein